MYLTTPDYGTYRLFYKPTVSFNQRIIGRLQRASDDVATINHIQTRIIDREAKQMRCVATRNSDEDQDISDAVKQLLLSRDERLAKTFIESQSYLPEE